MQPQDELNQPAKRRFPIGIVFLAPLAVIPLLLLVPTPKELRRQRAFETIEKKYTKLTPVQIEEVKKLTAIPLKGQWEEDRVIIFPGQPPYRNIAYYTKGSLSSKYSLWRNQKIGLWMVPIWNPESPLSNLAYQVSIDSADDQRAERAFSVVASSSKFGAEEKRQQLLSIGNNYPPAELDRRRDKILANQEFAGNFLGYGVAIVRGKYFQLKQESDAINILSEYPD